MPTVYIRGVTIHTVDYTDEGEHKEAIATNAVMFRDTWPVVKDMIVVTTEKDVKLDFKRLDMEVLNQKAGSLLYGPSLWNKFKVNVYDVTKPICKDRISILFKIENALEKDKTLLLCSEVEIQYAMRVVGKDWATHATVNSNVSLLRRALFNIGREYKWKDGAPVLHMGHTLVLPYNPVTDTIKKDLFDIADANVDDDGGSNARSYGGPTSLPFISWYTTQLMSDFIKKVEDARKPVKIGGQTASQILNAGQLNILMMFLAHTGARPGNVVQFLKYSDLYFNELHKKVYWLSLVFVKPTTLWYIVKNDIIKKYIMNLHNGEKNGGKKKRDTTLHWEKSTIPCEYNMLDLPYITVIIWRILGHFGLRFDDDLVFKRAPQKRFSELLGTKNDKLNIKNFVMYSLRYGAAKEDVESGIVPVDVTRERMTHTLFSTTAENVYAACDKRIQIDGQDLALPNATLLTDNMGLIWTPQRANDSNMRAYKTGFLDEAFSDAVFTGEEKVVVDAARLTLSV